MINYSIIIPHYNSVATLEKLLNSIPKRKDIQVIVVDDKSTIDRNNLNILKSKIIYDHVEFYDNTKIKSAGTCRNIGLSKAKGKWIIFADADDYFEPEFLKIIDKYCVKNYDVIFFPPTSVDIDTGKISDRHLFIDNTIKKYLKNYNRNDEIILRYRIGYPHSRMIKRDFIRKNKIFFDEVIASNDKMFNVKVGHFIENFYVSNEIIYSITKNNQSLTMNINEEIFDSRLFVYINYYNFSVNNIEKSELKIIKLSDQTNEFLIGSLKYGAKKVLNTYKLLKRNSIKTNIFFIFNPFIGIRYIIKYLKNIYYNFKYYHAH